MPAFATVLVCVLGNLMLSRAPVPAEPPPDPLARGYIGITVATGALTIERVEPRTPAAKAGLQSGDVLVRVGSLEPNTFEQVVLHICSFRPGAVVEVEVLRGGQRKTFKVKLAGRPPELDPPGSVPGRPRPVPIEVDD
jgi:S1-C subfamily serine protease